MYSHFLKNIFLRYSMVAILVSSVSLTAIELPGLKQSAQQPQLKKSWLGQSVVYGGGALLVGNVFSSRGFNVVGDACKYGAGMLGAFGLKSYIGSWLNNRAAMSSQAPVSSRTFSSPGGTRELTIRRVEHVANSSALNWNRIFNYGIGAAGVGLFAYKHHADFSHVYANILKGFYGWKGNVSFSNRVMEQAVTTYQSLPSAAVVRESLQNLDYSAYMPSQPVRNFFMAQGAFGSFAAAFFSSSTVRAQQHGINALEAQRRSDADSIVQLGARLREVQARVAEMEEVFAEVGEHLDRADRMSTLVDALVESPVRSTFASPRTPASKVRLTLSGVRRQFGTEVVQAVLAQVPSESGGAPRAKVGNTADRSAANAGSPFTPRTGRYQSSSASSPSGMSLANQLYRKDDQENSSPFRPKARRLPAGRPLRNRNFGNGSVGEYNETPRTSIRGLTQCPE